MWLKYYHPRNKEQISYLVFLNSRCIGLLLVQSCLPSKEQKQQTKEQEKINVQQMNTQKLH